MLFSEVEGGLWRRNCAEQKKENAVDERLEEEQSHEERGNKK